MVVVLSDFGRTPKVNPSAGRDHWSTAGIALLAGGGIRPALAVGQTDALGEQPTEAPYYTEDVAATIYDRLGIPLDTTHHTPDGRPIQVNYDGTGDSGAGVVTCPVYESKALPGPRRSDKTSAVCAKPTKLLEPIDGDMVLKSHLCRFALSLIFLRRPPLVPLPGNAP